MRYWWLGTRPWHTIHNLALWVDLLLFASFAPFKICTIWLIILFPYPVDGHMYPSFILFQSFSLFCFDFQFSWFVLATLFVLVLQSRARSRFLNLLPQFSYFIVLPSVIHHSFYIAVKLFTIKWSLQSHFIWRCDGDLLQRNLMFSLDIYTSDSHLDRVIWINSSKNVHVHLQECHSYINQAKITDSRKQISFIWSSISNLRHCLKIINYLIIL